MNKAAPHGAAFLIKTESIETNTKITPCVLLFLQSFLLLF